VEAEAEVAGVEVHQITSEEAEVVVEGHQRTSEVEEAVVECLLTLEVAEECHYHSSSEVVEVVQFDQDGSP
jgi:hypothetical protein